MKYLDLPFRYKKPRTSGITSLHDISYSIGELRHILEDYSEFIDLVKFGIGTAAIIKNLKKKIDLYKEFNIDVYFGGTLFEKFYYQNKLERYKEMLKNYDIGIVEISSGTINITLEKRLEIVKDFSQNFDVLCEVGCKDSAFIMPPSEWIKEINAFLSVGCKYVVTEGRNSGDAGLFRQNGELRTGLISDIITEIGHKKLIFEAPNSQSQNYFLNLLGANANLGNISPKDVLLLESQRQGLRSETFFLK